MMAVKFLSEYDDEEILKEAFKRKLFTIVEEKVIVKVPKKIYEDEIEIIKVPKKIYEYADGTKHELDPQKIIEENRNLRKSLENLRYQSYQDNKYKVVETYDNTLTENPYLGNAANKPVAPVVTKRHIQHAELSAVAKITEEMYYKLPKEEIEIVVRKQLANEIAHELFKHPEAMRIDKVRTAHDKFYDGHWEKYYAKVRILLWK